MMDSLLEKLKLDDPWTPPRSWDSLADGGASSHAPSPPALYSTTSVSEPSLVRLAMNALYGMESALTSIRELSALLRYSVTDRTSHRITSLWTRCSSTSALGDLLVTIGQFGCIVFLLRGFVFTSTDFDDVGEIDESLKHNFTKELSHCMHKRSLINQAFAISVGKVLDGYISALNTLSASIRLRRCSGTNSGGCLTTIGHSEITLLEVYLHTAGLRTQIEALGNVCNVNHLTTSFPESSVEELRTIANSEFSSFPRGGALLSFLYAQLKVADPDNCTLLKFLFLQSYEPYCGFIRSWIYDGRISDPYDEFVVENVNGLSIYAPSYNEVTSGSPLPTIKVRDGVAVPCFLEECLVPLCRTGQQLQVIMKLLELCNNAGAYDTHKDILSCLVGSSSECPWFAFPLTFDKAIIETLALARADHYQKMLANVDNILMKFDFSSQLVASHGVSRKFANYPGKTSNQASFIVNDNLISPPTDGRNQSLLCNKVDSEASSTMDECFSAEDLLESSECSSSETSEDQNEAEQQFCAPPLIKQSYLHALDFSLSNPTNDKMQKFYGIGTSSTVKDNPSKINEKSGQASNSLRKETYLGCESQLSLIHETHVTTSKCGLGLSDGQRSTKDESTLLHSHDGGLLHTVLDLSGNPFELIASNKDQHSGEAHAYLNLDSLHLGVLKYDSTVFSTNPILNRGSFFDMRSMLRERYHANYRDSFFDFTSVRDPLKACKDKLASNSGPQFGADLSFNTEAIKAVVDTTDHLDRASYSGMIKERNANSCYVTSLHKKGGEEERLLHPNIYGGSAWESLLHGSSNINYSSTRDHTTRLRTAFEMPLDFVIKKYLLDEILLQYKYLSKLTIKLLKEGFKLQEHLLSLRCYHFMELADWADLFIMSLWHRKWHVNEVDKRIPEIQGVLELSVQRSSCEGDPNKDRLFIYLKGDGNKHLSASITGVHSFDFLGLGYRVDWPVNIILTPAALKIYSEIFNFLIQVKLAAFSLSDTWCSLKRIRTERPKEEVNQVSVVIEIRHKVNHFVSALQQYVQSQLSQVSWCRFLHSLKHKVQDMCDLESVHMAYLTESLHICFLSDETRQIANIIQSILQCAMDFRSCFTGIFLEAGSGRSEVDIPQVHSIRRRFTKNLEELYSIYLQSPKHGEFSISRFWDYLNYNDHYSGVMSTQVGYSYFCP